MKLRFTVLFVQLACFAGWLHPFLRNSWPDGY
jgi:hypothetical protein